MVLFYNLLTDIGLTCMQNEGPLIVDFRPPAHERCVPLTLTGFFLSKFPLPCLPSRLSPLSVPSSLSSLSSP